MLKSWLTRRSGSSRPSMIQIDCTTVTCIELDWQEIHRNSEQTYPVPSATVMRPFGDSAQQQRFGEPSPYDTPLVKNRNWQKLTPFDLFDKKLISKKSKKVHYGPNQRQRCMVKWFVRLLSRTGRMLSLPLRLLLPMLSLRIHRRCEARFFVFAVENRTMSGNMSKILCMNSKLMPKHKKAYIELERFVHVKEHGLPPPVHGCSQSRRQNQQVAA